MVQVGAAMALRRLQSVFVTERNVDPVPELEPQSSDSEDEFFRETGDVEVSVRGGMPGQYVDGDFQPDGRPSIDLHKHEVAARHKVKAKTGLQKAFTRKNIFRRLRNLNLDIFLGLTVALMMIPEALAFAFTAGVGPLVGLYASAFMVFITSAIGGRPGMISGASGAIAVAQTSIVSDKGEEYLFAAVILCGVLEVIIAFLNLGKFVRLIPFPVFLGFVDGLAIVIGVAQLKAYNDASGAELGYMIMLTVIGFVIDLSWPRLPCGVGRIVPSSLVAIVTTTTIEQAFSLGTPTVEDVSGNLFLPSVPDITLTKDNVWTIILNGITFAAIGLIETFMTMELLDEITETKGNIFLETMAQGVGNFVSGWFGTMGGNSMLGQSLINVSGGGVRRLSGVLAGIFIIIFILSLGSFISLIPKGGLCGVMFVIVMKTFDWNSIPLFLSRKIPWTDKVIVLTVIGITLYFNNLALGVLIGTTMASFVHVWHVQSTIDATTSYYYDSFGNHVKVYYIHGPIFFGSVATFNSLFKPQDDPTNVIIDFKDTIVWDSTAAEALVGLIDRYTKNDRSIFFRNLSVKSVRRLKNKDRSAIMHNVNQPGPPKPQIDPSLGGPKEKKGRVAFRGHHVAADVDEETRPHAWSVRVSGRVGMKCSACHHLTHAGDIVLRRLQTNDHMDLVALHYHLDHVKDAENLRAEDLAGLKKLNKKQRRMVIAALGGDDRNGEIPVGDLEGQDSTDTPVKAQAGTFAGVPVKTMP